MTYNMLSQQTILLFNIRIKVLRTYNVTKCTDVTKRTLSMHILASTQSDLILCANNIVLRIY